VIGRAAKGRAAIGQVGSGRARMGQVGTGRAKMGRLGTGRSGTGRLPQTFLLLTGCLLVTKEMEDTASYEADFWRQNLYVFSLANKDDF
jgi:hypothetical protein